MDYLYYAFHSFYSSLPFVKGKENIDTSTMSGLGVGLVVNGLTVLECFISCLKIDSEDVILFAYLAVCILIIIIITVYYTDDKVQEILHRYKGRKYALNLVLYGLISFFLLIFSTKL